MSTTAFLAVGQPFLATGSNTIRQDVQSAIDDVIASLPDPARLSAEESRGMIARYAAVLEGNFIYWMTAALLAVRSHQAREIILENLREEISDCHPGMMRRFAVAAGAVPTDSDATAVYPELSDVRLFVGRLSPLPLLMMMAFFEGFIQRFMEFLADLAERQGSAELEYTTVHGVCDIEHSEGLFRAIESEIKIAPPNPQVNLSEGVDILRSLIQRILIGAIES